MDRPNTTPQTQASGTQVGEGDPGATMAELLDAIPGAFDRARSGLRQAASFDTVDLDALERHRSVRDTN